MSALIGALLLSGALALGGGSALLVWGLAGLARWPLRAAALAALYLAPGLVLLRLLWPRSRPLAPLARLSLALGLSVALPPLLLLAAQLVGLRWGGAATWAYLLLSLMLNVGFWAVDFGSISRKANVQDPQFNISLDGAGLALLGIVAATLLVRLYAARDLHVGLLGDSYHHTLMVQLLIDNGGIFHSWQPYAPLATFTYHFGFHTNAALVHYLTGLDAIQSVILTGQIMNALAAPLLFALAVALGGSRWAGVWAALIAGFVANIPAFYVNWGRYTQLTGQVVLMALVVCWVTLAETATKGRGPRAADRGPRAKARETNPRFFGLWSLVFGQNMASSWRLVLLTALVTTAMILTHYLVTALAGLFVASYLLALVVARRDWRAAGSLALRAGLAAGLALLLAAPWIANILRGYLLQNATGIAGGSVAAVSTMLSTLEPVAPKYVARPVLLGALAGLLIACWRRDWRMAVPAVWCALLVAVVVPYTIGLPGAGVIDTLTGLGTLFIPTALLAGYALAASQALVARLLARLGQPASRAIGAVLAAALLLATVALNTGWQTRVIAGDTALVADADLAAMAWIRENTPADARFLINSFPAYGGTLAAGSDAGWWLPLLAGRQASLPALTYGSEVGEQPTYRRDVNRFVAALRGRPLTDATPLKVDLTRPDALALLAGAGIGYVYSGAHPFPGPAAADRIDTAKLRASPAFRLVYARDGVEIFQIQKSTS
ncbi:MAG: hypothetical protein IPO81_03985 [Kouleothrix sp.]|nr:hypothetical protein [Kouleothrix sp.]